MSLAFSSPFLIRSELSPVGTWIGTCSLWRYLASFGRQKIDSLVHQQSRKGNYLQLALDHVLRGYLRWIHLLCLRQSWVCQFVLPRTTTRCIATWMDCHHVCIMVLRHYMHGVDCFESLLEKVLWNSSLWWGRGSFRLAANGRIDRLGTCW